MSVLNRVGSVISECMASTVLSMEEHLRINGWPSNLSFLTASLSDSYGRDKLSMTNVYLPLLV